MELSVSVKVVLDSYHLSERVLRAVTAKAAKGVRKKKE
jgi:hypothetical protein